MEQRLENTRGRVRGSYGRPGHQYGNDSIHSEVTGCLRLDVLSINTFNLSHLRFHGLSTVVEKEATLTQRSGGGTLFSVGLHV